ncbi:MAG TPA: DUF1259 domain-containing protein [Gemmatimonadales bacterium]|nr:DUF1259 domain-containing protein [Gemmatimonadales bacterium]
MGRRAGIALLAGAVAALARAAPAAAQEPVVPPWDSVAAILETPAVPAAGYVRYNFPRRDFTVRLGDVTLAVPLVAGAWAGFAGSAADALVMGDLVLTPGELGPVEAALLHQRLEVTGIHDHLVGEQPRLVSVHFHAEGAALDLARRLDSVLARTLTPRPVAAVVAPPVTVDTATVFRVLGRGGRAQGSVVQLGFLLVSRPVRWHKRTLPPALALATPVNIQAITPRRAVATGDFAVLEAQVAPVLRAMAANGIVVEALHGHMVGETPPVYFIHFWADGSLPAVVAGLKAAIDAAR